MTSEEIERSVAIQRARPDAENGDVTLPVSAYLKLCGMALTAAKAESNPLLERLEEWLTIHANELERMNADLWMQEIDGARSYAAEIRSLLAKAEAELPVGTITDNRGDVSNLQRLASAWKARAESAEAALSSARAEVVEEAARVCDDLARIAYELRLSHDVARANAYEGAAAAIRALAAVAEGRKG